MYCMGIQASAGEVLSLIAYTSRTNGIIILWETKLFSLDSISRESFNKFDCVITKFHFHENNVVR